MLLIICTCIILWQVDDCTEKVLKAIKENKEEVKTDGEG